MSSTGETQPLKKLKEEPPLASPTVDDYDKGFNKSLGMQFKVYEPIPFWPLRSQQREVDRILRLFKRVPFNPRVSGDISSKAELVVNQAVEKAEKELKEYGLSPEKVRDVYDDETRRLVHQFYGCYQNWYTATKNEVSSVRTFYQSQHEEFSATFGEYFQSPEAIQALLSDEAKIYSFLVEQHPKLMELLKEKQEKLKKQ